MSKKVEVKRILPLVDEYKGNLAAIARRLGTSRTTIHKRVNESEVLRAAIEEAREAMIDNVESSLYRDALADNVTAKIFFLKTQGKRRGYVERQEITGAEGGPISVNIEFGDG